MMENKKMIKNLLKSKTHFKNNTINKFLFRKYYLFKLFYIFYIIFLIIYLIVFSSIYFRYKNSNEDFINQKYNNYFIFYVYFNIILIIILAYLKKLKTKLDIDLFSKFYSFRDKQIENLLFFISIIINISILFFINNSKNDSIQFVINSLLINKNNEFCSGEELLYKENYCKLSNKEFSLLLLYLIILVWFYFFELSVCLLELNVFYNERSIRIFKNMNIKLSKAFILKINLNKFSIIFTFLLFKYIALFFTILFFIAENYPSNYEKDFFQEGESFKSFFFCFWYISYTLLTIGYGDAKSVSILGRIIIIICSIVGVIINGLIVVIFDKVLVKFEYHEYKSYYVIKRLILKDKITEKLKEISKKFLKYKILLLNKQTIDYNEYKSKIQNESYYIINDIKNNRNEYKNSLDKNFLDNFIYYRNKSKIIIKEIEKCIDEL